MTALKSFIKDFCQIKINYNIGKKTWFGSGGNSLFFIQINSIASLILFLKIIPKNFPFFIIGAGSNIIIRDGGFKGIVVKLGSEFNKIIIDKKKQIINIGSATKDMEISKFCLENSISGFEFLRGIPGTLGGNLRMNSGCFGHEISESLLSCRLINKKGEIRELQKNNIFFGYRKTSIEKNSIIIDAKFRFEIKKKSIIKNKIQKISNLRKKTQPISSRTGGSTFTNPNKKTAWHLIDEIGYRGKRLGGASVSKKHSNFLINDSTASSLDIELLGEEIRERVWSRHKIKLNWEIIRIGNFKKI